MPKVVKSLSAIEVKRLTLPKLHSVGNVQGLGLKISASGAKSWILRTTVQGHRHDVGLGSYPSVTLADAVVRARFEVEQVKSGINPVQIRKERKAIGSQSFKDCAQAYLESHRSEWKNAKHAQQWENTLITYAYPKIGSMHVRDIGVKHILQVLKPHWVDKTETMTRVRQRIEAVLAWSAVMGYRPVQNPAVWRNNIDQLLPKQSKVSKAVPHASLQTKDVQAFYKALSEADGQGAKCLLFAMLTAGRSGEARGALWSEIDLDASEWLVPASRMKAGTAHRVPLSVAAVSLLRSLVRFDGTDLIFVGNKNQQLSDMTVAAVIRRLNKPVNVWVDVNNKPVVPHGLRSTFATWSQEFTNYPSELREHALAHRVGNATTQSYERGAMFEKRRALMQDWASFVSAPVPNVASVTSIQSAVFQKAAGHKLS